MLCHEAVDLTYWQTACFAIPQSQEYENTEKKYSTMKHYQSNCDALVYFDLFECVVSYIFMHLAGNFIQSDCTFT